MRVPPVRVVLPSPAQLAGDPDAMYAAFVPVQPAGDRFRAALNRLHESGEGPLVLQEDGTSFRVSAAKPVLQRFAAYLAGVGHFAGAPLRRCLAPVPAWQLRTRSLPMDRPNVMGILNLTDDSFSGDGVGRDVTAAVARAGALRAAGAAIIDVGAESARADRPVVDEKVEAEIVRTVVAALVADGHLVSSDSYKPRVVEAALEAGAEIVNDISGLTLGTGAAELAAKAGAGYVLNYSYTVPKRRPDSPPVYADVVAETLAWLFERVGTLREAGLADARVAVDPGIAFGKSHDEDIAILRRLGELTSLGLPLLLAHSRKNYIGSIDGHPPGDRDLETHVTTALAFAQGARIFRVHDVAGTRRALAMAHALTTASAGDFAPDAGSWPWRAGVSVPHSAAAAPRSEAPRGQRW